MAQEKIQCTVQVLTLNSGKTLEKCLESVKDFAEIIILDGNSTDNTLEIAKQYTHKIYPQTDSKEKNIRIEDFSAVRNRGLKLATLDWFLFIDSDEYLSKESVEEIRHIVKQDKDNTYFVYNLPRKYVLNGIVLEQMKPTYQPRFFYISATDGFKKRVHERIYPKQGYEIGTLKNPEFVPLEDIKELQKKWNHYLDIEQDKMKDITWPVFFVKMRANIIKFLKYFVKMMLNLLAHPKSGIPIKYEFYNAVYHLQIIKRLFVNLMRNSF
ncbi:MAG: hypothetical protein AUJ34_03175, partial [Parcubacteria group bacterium CG1_02_41_12]